MTIDLLIILGFTLLLILLLLNYYYRLQARHFDLTEGALGRVDEIRVVESATFVQTAAGTERDDAVEPLSIEGSKVVFHFRGKSGVQHEVSVKDRRLARLIKRCQDLPGQDLFQYLDEKGDRHSVSSSDVNAYLHSLTGADFTAKDFRTWAATVMALAALRELEWQPESDAKRHVVAMIKDVARHLGNTSAVCRKSYIHPAVLEHFSLGELARLPSTRARNQRIRPAQ